MRSLAMLGAVVLLLALSAGAAQAHATLVSSDPAAGQRLATAPALVVLRFTEPLNTRLSRVTVTDPNGQRFQGGARGPAELGVRLLTNAPGAYRVAWATVSVVDGHTLHGGFAFGVGVPVGGAGQPGGQAEGGADTSPRPADVLVAAGRAAEDAALLLAVGMLLLVGLAWLDPPLPRVRPRVHVALAVALTAGLAVSLAEAAAAAAVHGLSAGGMAAYLTSGLAGWARLARVALEALALGLASRWSARGDLRASLAAALTVALAVVALAAAGHAAGATPAWWGVTADAAHLLAAGLWAGGIAALATTRLQQGWLGWTGPQGRALVARFSPVALGAFVVSAGFGVVQALQQVGTIRALLGSSYGRVLEIKMLAVAAMVPLSVRAWQRRPALRAEAALGLTAVALAALLAAYPLPPARLARVEAQARQPTPDPALPRPGDLTMGGHVGPVLVGLTVRPGSPGRNDLLVYLLPAEGELAAAAIPVAVAVDGHAVPVERCGPACRRSTAALTPAARVDIAVAAGGAGAGQGAGVAAFRLPLLPAPDGSALLARMQQRMHHLSTLRYTEVLSSGLAGSPLHSYYQQQAPDRLQVQTSTGSETVWVGRTYYVQRQAGAGWISEPAATPYTVPSFVWDYLPTQLLDPRIVGAARVGGVATKMLAFYGPTGSSPIWFRLWVDADGLVRRAEMRAPGHFMDQRYGDFDGPIAIQAPVAPR
jgi:copper transport protein